MNLRKFCHLPIITVCFSLVASVSVHAQESSPKPQNNWSVGCTSTARGAETDCRMEQQIVVAKTRQLLLQATITIPGTTRKPILIFKSPTQLLLTAGVTVDVDGTLSENLPYYTCDTQNCFARAQLSDALLAAMKKGAELNVSFDNLNGNKIKVAMSLEGFTAAYTKVE